MTSDQEWKAQPTERIHRTVGGPTNSDWEGPANTQDYQTLLAYSEWLDGQGLVIGDGSPVINSVMRKLPGEDMRTHSDLVAEFLNERDLRESERNG